MRAQALEAPAAQAASPAASEAPPLEDSALVRVVVEVALPRAPQLGQGTGRTRTIYGLAGVVQEGGSLLEDVAVTAMCCLRGGAAFSERVAWAAERAIFVARAVATIGGRRFVVSGCRWGSRGLCSDPR